MLREWGEVTLGPIAVASHEKNLEAQRFGACELFGFVLSAPG